MAREGSSVVAAVMVLLVLSSLALLMSAQVAGDQLVAAGQVEASRALYAAEAGLEFALGQLESAPTWTGVTAPGLAVGPASFTVAVSDSSVGGSPLPSGQKRITAQGVSGQAVRRLSLRVQLGS